MTQEEIKRIKTAISSFASIANVDNDKALDDLVNSLSKMDINDAMDRIIVTLNRQVSIKRLSEKDVLNNASLITAIYPEKYPDAKSLLDRLHFLKEMNMEYPQMPLKENHKLVVDAFDNFNKLIGTNFDAYYTGGLMGYLATSQELQRYHGDLDLFINEEQLIDLYDVVKNSKDFKFESNLDKKDETGHEFKITYKDTPMSIGLFLFERTQDKEMVVKEYYYKDGNVKNGLFVNEHYLSEDFSKLLFEDIIYEHNGTPYKMQSLEGIYNAKKNQRPKDRFDAKVIEPFIDKEKEQKLDMLKRQNYDMLHERAIGTPIIQIDNMIKQNLETINKE